MLSDIKGEYSDSTFLLNAVAAWFISALILLLVCSGVLNVLENGGSVLGYASSAVSFASALAAGAAAEKRRREAPIYTGLISAAVLVTIMLTIGYIVDGAEIDASAVLSVVSFTFTGCLAGSVFFGGVKKRDIIKLHR